MSWRRIIIYYVVAIALALHVRAEVTARGGFEPPVEAVTTEPFISALTSRMDRVRVETAGLVVRFRREGERWVVTQPEGVDSSSDIVDAILDTFTTIGPIEVVADGAGADGAFGLNPPRTRVRIDGGGELVTTIALGDRNPTRTAVYVKKSGDPRVYLLGLNAQYYIDLVFESVKRQLDLRNGESRPSPNAASADVSPADEAESPSPVAGDQVAGDQTAGNARLESEEAAPPVAPEGGGRGPALD